MAAKRKKSMRRNPATNKAAAPGAGTNKPRIARVAKGKRPQYFSDPAIDKLLWMTVSLMEELSVTRDRLDAVERLLERKKTLRRGEVENFAPDAAAAAERDTRRAAFIERVMRVVQAELEEMSRDDMPRSSEEVVAAVAS
jgi:hypothetical protein